jgi:hypothetical protein
MSALLKQKSKIGVAVKPRKKYDSFDFGKKIKANDGLPVATQPTII